MTFHNRPCAAPGLISYRYRSLYGFVMIGAHNDADALRQASLSILGTPDISRLDVWVEEAGSYRSVQ